MSEHFKTYEFACKCGCGQTNVNLQLLDKLELLRHALGDNPVNIVSGVRCGKHSQAVGGYANDMHVLGGAADINVRKPDGTLYKAETIAEQAEKVGFSGIGIITDNNVHVDIRGIIPYSNTHWFGDERNGANIATFEGKGEKVEFVSRETINITVTIDGVQYNGDVTRI